MHVFYQNTPQKIKCHIEEYTKCHDKKQTKSRRMKNDEAKNNVPLWRRTSYGS